MTLVIEQVPAALEEDHVTVKGAPSATVADCWLLTAKVTVGRVVPPDFNKMIPSFGWSVMEVTVVPSFPVAWEVWGVPQAEVPSGHFPDAVNL